MKRIGLYLGSDLSSGGVFQYSETILNALMNFPSGEYELRIVCSEHDWCDYLKKLGLGFSFCRRPKYSRLSNWLSLAMSQNARMRNLARYWNPVISTLINGKCDLWLFPAQDVIGALAPVRSLISIHDLMHRYERRFAELGSPLRYLAREMRFRGICGGAHAILVDSKVGAQHVSDSYGLRAENIYRLPYIAPSYIYRSAPVSIDFDRRYLLPKKFFFYPAQFWTHKNHARLIKAIGSLTAEYPDIQIVFAGSLRQLHRELRILVNNLGLARNIHFLGFIPEADVVEVYRRARAMIMPTFLGPTNIPPLEAFALGCPVAASNIYAMPEQLGAAALLFDPESTNEIVHVLRRLWSDDELCKRLSHLGRIRSVEWSQVQFTAELQRIIECNIPQRIRKQATTSLGSP